MRTKPRGAPTTDANCATRNRAAVAKSGAPATAVRSASTSSVDQRSLCRVSVDSSRAELVKTTPQLRVLHLDALELVGRSQLARTRHRLRDTHGLGVFEVGIDGGDDDARLDRDQVDADQRHAHPRID